MPIIRISQDSPLTIEVFGKGGGGEPACSFTCEGVPSLKGKWTAKPKGGSAKELFDVTGPVEVEIQIQPGGASGGGAEAGGGEETSY